MGKNKKGKKRGGGIGTQKQRDQRVGVQQPHQQADDGQGAHEEPVQVEDGIQAGDRLAQREMVQHGEMKTVDEPGQDKIAAVAVEEREEGLKAVQEEEEGAQPAVQKGEDSVRMDVEDAMIETPAEVPGEIRAEVNQSMRQVAWMDKMREWQSGGSYHTSEEGENSSRGRRQHPVIADIEEAPYEHDVEEWMPRKRPSEMMKWFGWLVILMCWLVAWLQLEPSQAAMMDCFGADANVTVIQEDSVGAHVLGSVYGVLAKHQNNPRPILNERYVISGIYPPDACSPIENITLPDGVNGSYVEKTVLVRRGNCSFLQKATNLEAAGINLFLEYDGIGDLCVRMELDGHARNASLGEAVNNATDPLIGLSLTTHAALDMIQPLIPTEGDVQDVIEVEGRVRLNGTHYGVVMLSAPVLEEDGIIDPAEFGLALFALLAIFLGSYWAVTVERDTYEKKNEFTSWLYGDVSATHDDFYQQHHVISLRAAWTFIFVASGILLLILILSSSLLSALLAFLFAVSAWDCMNMVVSRWAIMLLTGPGQTASSGVLYTAEVCVLMMSTAISASWLLTRHTFYWWILQDVLSLFVLVSLFGVLRLPNLQVGTILLCSALIYDVWWVYIQPMVTGMSSVMVRVAKGLSLPLFVAIPEWSMSLGSNKSFAVLGLGDIMLPGLLLVFAKMCDIRSSYGIRREPTSWHLVGYFWPVMIAYFVGLCATYIALQYDVGGQSGQPALLYLVPCTLGVFVGLAAARKELKGLWRQSFQDIPRDQMQPLLADDDV